MIASLLAFIAWTVYSNVAPTGGEPPSHDPVTAVPAAPGGGYRDAANPMPVDVQLGQCPFYRFKDNRTPANVAQAALPWSRLIVPAASAVGTASLPWQRTSAAISPSGIMLAELPWKRDRGTGATPVDGGLAVLPWTRGAGLQPVAVAQAELPWLRDVGRGAEGAIAQAQLPWTRASATGFQPVALASANIPWTRDNAAGLQSVSLPSAVVPWNRVADPYPPVRIALAYVNPSEQRHAEMMERYEAFVATEDAQNKADLETPRKFVMSMCQDLQGRIWVGCEDQGVWMYDPAKENKDKLGPDGTDAAAWTNFTTKTGLTGDDNGYAIACDQQNRIWVGHLNHGVSVYNGQKWQNYEVVGGLSSPDSLSGPLGERVFAIKVCPTDGDVWIASSAGLTRYSPKTEDWRYYTRAEGLPSDQASALAFDKDGNLYVGTQCDGIAMADAKDNYKNWRQVTGADKMPTTPTGDGLPTNLINDVLVAKDGTVYAATTAGLAWSKDKGASWQYVRGKDWAAKVKGRFGGPPKGWDENQAGAVLAEDYANCVTEDASGNLWLGYRHEGYGRLRPGDWVHTAYGENQYVRAILPTGPEGRLVGSYGSALLPPVDSQRTWTPAGVGVAVTAVLPSGAAAPTTEAMRAIGARLQGAPVTKHIGAFVGEDWATQGDWVGRYGRQYAILCAMNSPQSNHELTSSGQYQVLASIGPHCQTGDALRHWIHTISTQNPKTLYSPVIGIRRQAEWDDHSEAYPPTWEGPDVWLSVTVPEGVHRISVYFYNKDGHTNSSRDRDYVVELRRSRGTAEYQLDPPLARCRVLHFWGGVYKQFITTEPGEYRLRIVRNGSFCTICSAVLVDEMKLSSSAAARCALPWMGGLRYDPPSWQLRPGERSAALADAASLWSALDAATGQTAADLCQRRYRVEAYRAAEQSGQSAAEQLALWRWQLRLWDDAQRDEFQDAMSEAWARMQKDNPRLRSSEFRPYSRGIRTDAVADKR